MKGIGATSTPIDVLLDRVEWKAVELPPAHEFGTDEVCDLPHVTHEGVLEFSGLKLRCYQLSTGQRIIDAEDLLGTPVKGPRGL